MLRERTHSMKRLSFIFVFFLRTFSSVFDVHSSRTFFCNFYRNLGFLQLFLWFPLECFLGLSRSSFWKTSNEILLGVLPGISPATPSGFLSLSSTKISSGILSRTGLEFFSRNSSRSSFPQFIYFQFNGKPSWSSWEWVQELPRHSSRAPPKILREFL